MFHVIYTHLHWVPHPGMGVSMQLISSHCEQTFSYYDKCVYSISTHQDSLTCPISWFPSSTDDGLSSHVHLYIVCFLLLTDGYCLPITFFASKPPEEKIMPSSQGIWSLADPGAYPVSSSVTLTTSFALPFLLFNWNHKRKYLGPSQPLLLPRKFSRIWPHVHKLLFGGIPLDSRNRYCQLNGHPPTHITHFGRRIFKTSVLDLSKLSHNFRLHSVFWKGGAVKALTDCTWST